MKQVSLGQRLLCFATLAIIAVTIVAATAVTIVRVADEATGSKDIISGKGTIIYLSFEGGFFGIVGDDGGHYDPYGGLDAGFQVDGLRVFFKARILRDVASYHMWGWIVEIISLSRIA